LKTLHIHNINKRFGSINVLNDLNIEIEEGSIYGFLGKNGAGKTTTLKIITGLIRSTPRGESDDSYVEICGQRLKFGDTSINANIGFLPDVPAFYNYMKPMDYLRLCGKIYGMKQPKLDIRANELLKLVGLSGVNRKIKGFSRGMKQRLGIAQAMIHRPKLLILDEPTSALDPMGRKEILDIILRLKGEYTVIFSTHILADVERVCDEIGILHNGSIISGDILDGIREKRSGKRVQIDTVPESHDSLYAALKTLSAENMLKEITVREAGAFTASVTDWEAFASRICHVLAERNVPLLRLDADEASLEDIFMEVIG
jgi:ABC-2 type transport system ATP-binding protein